VCREGKTLRKRLGPELPVPEWGKRLRCSRCGSRDCDFVVTGEGGMPEAERRAVSHKV
jgi:hypothetical protein